MSPTSNSFCETTDHGCWTATALVVDAEYANASGFNTQVTQHDFAFAVLEEGGNRFTDTRAADLRTSVHLRLLALCRGV